MDIEPIDFGIDNDRERDVAQAVIRLMITLNIPIDETTQDTPRRVARMLCREALAGLYSDPPRCTAFPNTERLDEIYAVGPIAVRSLCAHHLVPIQGKAWIAVLPDEKLMGLSKFHRLTAWVMARPQMQEQATHDLALNIASVIEPKGVAVVVRASHLCCTWRGVCDADQLMTTSVMLGTFRENPTARAEVFNLFRSQGF